MTRRTYDWKNARRDDRYDNFGFGRREAVIGCEGDVVGPGSYRCARCPTESARDREGSLDGSETCSIGQLSSGER